MVDRIDKVDTGHLRVDQKEGAHDEGGGQSSPQYDSPEQEKDEFGPKADFKTFIGTERQGKRPKSSFWNLSPAASSGARAEGAENRETELSHDFDEEDTASTTITFLRAAGILDRRGSPRWFFIGLYGFAGIGVLFTMALILRILL